MRRGARQAPLATGPLVGPSLSAWCYHLDPLCHIIFSLAGRRPAWPLARRFSLSDRVASLPAPEPGRPTESHLILLTETKKRQWASAAGRARSFFHEQAS